AADDKVRLRRLLPGYDTYDAEVHTQVENGYADDGDKDAAGNIPAGVPDLAAQVTYIIIAQVAVDGLACGLSQQQGEAPAEQGLISRRHKSIGLRPMG